jgi:hypothetical protein
MGQIRNASALLTAAALLTAGAHASMITQTQAYSGFSEIQQLPGHSNVFWTGGGGASGLFDAIASANLVGGQIVLRSATSIAITNYPAGSFQTYAGGDVISPAAAYAGVQGVVTVNGGAGEGNLIYSFLASGSASASDSTGAGMAQTGAWIDIWQGSGRAFYCLPSSPTPYSVTLSLPFTYGVPFSLSLWLETYGNVFDYPAGGLYSAQTSTDFNVAWYETRIADGAGARVPGAYLTADAPIPGEATPEPGTLALVGLGLAVALWRLRTLSGHGVPSS